MLTDYVPLNWRQTVKQLTLKQKYKEIQNFPAKLILLEIPLKVSISLWNGTVIFTCGKELHHDSIRIAWHPPA